MQVAKLAHHIAWPHIIPWYTISIVLEDQRPSGGLGCHKELEADLHLGLLEP
jgi:hypothetical protein